MPPYARMLNFDSLSHLIPFSFSPRDHCSLMEVTDFGRRLTYVGSQPVSINLSTAEADAATARTDCEIPVQCGIFYFETEIVCKGRDGFISIGLITKASSLKKLVGWENGTIGYHGDDGCAYLGSGKGHSFGPTFTVGDRIGCGVNYLKGHVFFTKNGCYVGDRRYPLDSSSDALYAAVGLKSKDETVLANFGFRPFAFDIEAYVRSNQAAYSQAAMLTVEPSLVDSPVTELLVLRHLIHTGCEQAALSFFRTALNSFKTEMTEEGIVATLMRSKLRRRYVDLVLQGHIDSCLEALQTDYPEVLASNPDLDFLLQARRFVELVLQVQKNKELLARVFPVGQALEDKLKATSNREYHVLARDVLALIAYPSPRDSPSAYLVGEAHRRVAATALEEALLKADCQSPYSALEVLLRSYQTNLDLLKEAGSLEVALVESVTQVLRHKSLKQD